MSTTVRVKMTISLNSSILVQVEIETGGAMTHSKAALAPTLLILPGFLEEGIPMQ